MTHTNLSEVERSSGNCFYDVTFETVCTQKNSINPLIYTNLMSHDFRTRTWRKKDKLKNKFRSLVGFGPVRGYIKTLICSVSCGNFSGGQGSQYVGMIKKLLVLPKVQQMFEMASHLWRTDLLKLCIDGPKSELDRTVNCQPVVFVASMAALEALKVSNPQALQDCYATAGFSIGEYSALVLSGALSFEDALRVIKVRAEEMQKASELMPSGLATAFLSRQSKLSLAMLASRKWCSEKLRLEGPVVCQVSSYMNAGCKVVGGNIQALDFLELNSKEFNILKLKRLPVSGAFHTELMKPAEAPLKAVLKDIEIKRPLIRVHFNYDSKSHSSPEKIRNLLVRQLSNPVKWEQTLNELYYDNNLPVDGAVAVQTAEEPADDAQKENKKVPQSENRVYPDIYECGPSPHTGPILQKINHKAYRFYKFIGV